VVDSHFTPTASFVRNPSAALHADLPLAELRRRLDAERLVTLDASHLAETYFGDAIASNILLTGHAFQLGLIPISLESILTAISLNGGPVAQNLRAFKTGRLAALRPETFAGPEPVASETLAELKARLADRLTAYQSPDYARRFLSLIQRAEAKVDGHEGAETFLTALMRGAYHVMAYKDEYEVARLLSAPDFLDSLRARFEGDLRLGFHLAPPLLSRRDARTGRPAKRAFGEKMLPVFRMLAKLKRLRGTPFDPFGYTHERRQERQFRDAYLQGMSDLIETLDPADLSAATRKAAEVMEVRGYGDVKLNRLAAFRTRNGEMAAGPTGT
jgi:indolepyruvate ferredoxin oxidoreductase